MERDYSMHIMHMDMKLCPFCKHNLDIKEGELEDWYNEVDESFR